MFRPLPLYIGLRYTRAKRRSHFVSFISLVSMLGIALGVTVLITVLSVMNGFDYEIRQRIFDMAEQVTISNFSGPLSEWQELSQGAAKFPGVISVAPYVSGQGMLSNAGNTMPVMVKGISPADEAKVSQLPAKIVKGSFDQLTPGSFGIVIGQNLADSLGLTVGDKVLLITPQATVTPLGIAPRFKRFTIVGLFN